MTPVIVLCNKCKMRDNRRIWGAFCSIRPRCSVENTSPTIKFMAKNLAVEVQTIIWLLSR